MLDGIPAGSIASDWTKIDITLPSSCDVEVYIGWVWYDQSEFKTLCTATTGCTFDETAYSENLLALKVYDNVGGNCNFSSMVNYVSL